MILRVHAIRLMLLALAGALLLLGGLAAAVARAEEYGGLGSLGVLRPGGNGEHLEVDALGNRAFGVDPADGSSYIADEIEISGKHYFRIQKVGSNGEYVAEVRGELLGPAYKLEGVAVDSEQKRLYVLVVTERIGEHPEIEEKLEVQEEKLYTKRSLLASKKKLLAEKRTKDEPTEQVEHEITTLEAEIAALEVKVKKLREEALPYDSEVPVAAKLYAFSTEAKEGKLAPAAGTQLEGVMRGS